MRKEHYLVKQYLHWTFRASFIDLIISDFIIFGLLCLAWAACIYLGALVSPRCFVVAGTPLSEIEDWKDNFFFMDALQLSWTTFSTVVRTSETYKPLLAILVCMVPAHHVNPLSLPHSGLWSRVSTG